MKKVIHLIPYDGIGGVESAAKTMLHFNSELIDFRIIFIFNNIKNKNFLNFFYRTYELIKINPDLLIVSLWRSCIVGILFKMLKPNSKLVLFLHYPHHYHFLDKIFTKTMSFFCNAIWADSNDTLKSRLPNFSKNKTGVISFVARRFKPVTAEIPKPNFIFWGRLHEQKAIHFALEIFAGIKEKYNDASFTIIGPDGGEKTFLKNLSNNLGIQNNTKFLGPKDLNSIINLSRDASFYLQTSKLEGMAMSVVEGMQLGLVPLVTPVGEIKNYCKDMHNSILIYDLDRAKKSILDLINNKSLFQEIRKNTIDSWSDSEIYPESIETASIEMLGIKKDYKDNNY